MSSFELRQIRPDEWPAFVSRISDAFGNIPTADEFTVPPLHALERCVGAFNKSGVLIGTGVNHAMQLTLPGGARVPVGGVAGISVSPTHRRQGVMSAVIDWLIADAMDRGEVASVLTASEGSIYWKRGYGPATWAMTAEVTAGSSLYPPASGGASTSGSLRMINDPTVATAAMADIHERASCARPGSISRPAHLWREVFQSYTDDNAHWRLVVHASSDGTDDGYAFYGMVGEWSTHSVSEQFAVVHELVSTGSVPHRALWEHLLSLDLSKGVKVTRIGLHDPIRLLLDDPRSLRVTGSPDRLWVRPLDVQRLFSARTLGDAGQVVIQLTGPSDAKGHTRFMLSADGCEPLGHDRTPDLVMSSAGLGAVSLGGTSAVDLVGVGRIEEMTNGAAATLDALLRTSPSPMMTTAF